MIPQAQKCNASYIIVPEVKGGDTDVEVVKIFTDRLTSRWTGWTTCTSWGGNLDRQLMEANHHLFYRLPDNKQIALFCNSNTLLRVSFRGAAPYVYRIFQTILEEGKVIAS